MTHQHTDHFHAHGHNPPVLASSDIDAAAAVLADADRVLIGAGAGLSAAAGYDYADPVRFAELFPALKRAGFNDRYELMGYPLQAGQQWGFWAAQVRDIRLGDESSALYQRLRAAVADRPSFVMSSNVDALFTRNGFDHDRVFTPQGDYALYQCLTPCTREVWDARPILERAWQTLDHRTGQIPEDTIPICPNCSGAVYLNVNAGPFYIADHFWSTGAALNDWLVDEVSLHQSGGMLAVLDIGSGYNTPGVIRRPMEQVARGLPNATLIRVNRDHPEVPTDIAARSFSLGGDAAAVIERLAAASCDA